MIGAGVLGLPNTFVYLGWWAGMVTMFLAFFASWYSFKLLVKMHELPEERKEGRVLRRHNRYSELSEHLLGECQGLTWFDLV